MKNEKHSDSEQEAYSTHFSLSSRFKAQLEFAFYLFYPLVIVFAITLVGYLSLRFYYSGNYGAGIEKPQPTESSDLQDALKSKYIAGDSHLDNWRQIDFEGVLYLDDQYLVFHAEKTNDGIVRIRSIELDQMYEFSLHSGRIDSLQSYRLDQIDPKILSLAFFLDDMRDAGNQLETGQISSIEKIRWRGDVVQRIQSIPEDELSMRNLYFRPEDMQLVGREDFFQDGTTKTLKYSEYREKGGLSFPYYGQIQINGGSWALLKFRDIKPHYGLAQDLRISTASK